MIAFLNYNKTYAINNGEFNLLKHSKEYVLKEANFISCKRCGLINDGILFNIAVLAVQRIDRRFPELVGNR